MFQAGNVKLRARQDMSPTTWGLDRSDVLPTWARPNVVCDVEVGSVRGTSAPRPDCCLDHGRSSNLEEPTAYSLDCDGVNGLITVIGTTGSISARVHGVGLVGLGSEVGSAVQ